jgi:hypothetical protein
VNVPRGLWRRGRDSNPRDSFESNGFQDRRFQPLTHPSVSNFNTFSGLATTLLPLLPHFVARCSRFMAVPASLPSAATFEEVWHACATSLLRSPPSCRSASTPHRDQQIALRFSGWRRRIRSSSPVSSTPKSGTSSQSTFRARDFTGMAQPICVRSTTRNKYLPHFARQHVKKALRTFEYLASCKRSAITNSAKE